MIDPIDFPKLVQKLGVAVVEAHDLAKLRAVTSLVLYYLAPDFDLAEQQRPIRDGGVTILIIRSDHVPKRVNPVRSHIAGSWLVWVPNVISHEDTVETIMAIPKPTFVDHPPSPVCDDLSHTRRKRSPSVTVLVFRPRSPPPW